MHPSFGRRPCGAPHDTSCQMFWDVPMFHIVTARTAAGEASRRVGYRCRSPEARNRKLASVRSVSMILLSISASFAMRARSLIRFK